MSNGYTSACFQRNNAKKNTPTPIIDSIKVGVNTPESGVGGRVAEGEAVKVALGVEEGEAVGEILGVAEGVASYAGPSEAATTKFLTKDLVMPWASFQVMVILWDPSDKPCGGVHFQSPDWEIWTLSVVTGSDSTAIVRLILAGPWPKNSGIVVLIISPSLTLSKVTDWADGVAIWFGTLKPDC